MYCTIRNYNTDCNIKRVLVENRKPELGENDLSAETVVRRVEQNTTTILQKQQKTKDCFTAPLKGWNWLSDELVEINTHKSEQFL